MTMTANARAAAIFTAVQNGNPNFSKLNSAEKAALQTQLQTIFGADLTYITTNATVVPTALVTPAGGLVSTVGSPTAQTGTVTSAVSVTGTGSVS